MTATVLLAQTHPSTRKTVLTAVTFTETTSKVSVSSFPPRTDPIIAQGVPKFLAHVAPTLPYTKKLGECREPISESREPIGECREPICECREPIYRRRSQNALQNLIYVAVVTLELNKEKKGT